MIFCARSGKAELKTECPSLAAGGSIPSSIRERRQDVDYFNRLVAGFPRLLERSFDKKRNGHDILSIR